MMIDLIQLLEKLNQVPPTQWKIQGHIDNACVRYHESLEGTHDSWVFLTKTKTGYELLAASIPKDGREERVVLGRFEDDKVNYFADCLCDSQIYLMRKEYYD